MAGASAAGPASRMYFSTASTLIGQSRCRVTGWRPTLMRRAARFCWCIGLRRSVRAACTRRIASGARGGPSVKREPSKDRVRIRVDTLRGECMLEIDWDRDGEGSKAVGGAQDPVGFGNFVGSVWSCSRWWDGRRWRWRWRRWRWRWRYRRYRRYARFSRLGRRWLYRARRVACEPWRPWFASRSAQSFQRWLL